SVYGRAHAAFPPTRHELDGRAALARDPRIAAVPEVARGVALVNARRGPGFTRFDGNLADRAAVLAARSPSSDGVAISATRLEMWVKCPHAYFARYLLHLKAIELPEELIQLSPMDKGNIVHATLDRLADGRLAVIDYKTGSSTRYSAVSQDAPLQNGELLQLPIYAHAARTLLGDDSGEPVLAEYWFVLREPRRPRGYDVDPEVEQ